MKTSQKSILSAIILSLSFLICSFSIHKFYTSQTDMWYNFDTGSLEITVRLFTDDFEKTLEDKSNTKFFIGTPQEHTDTDSLIYTYFKEHFILSQGNKSASYNFIGKKAELDNIIYVYLEAKNFNDESRLTVENTILFELYEEQLNTINYENEDLLQSASLNKDKIKTTFKSPYE